jgi:hypothetical protein
MIRIQQTRIRKIPESIINFNSENLFIIVEIDQKIKEIAGRLGFQDLTNGEQVLPMLKLRKNKITKGNANGFIIVRRDLPMISCTYTIPWPHEEYCGYKETKTVTTDVDRTYKKYPRERTIPHCVELIVTEKNNKKYITTNLDSIQLKQNLDLLKHTINLFLEIFGECYLSDQIEIPIFIQRKNWEILPPGSYPWPKIVERINKDTKVIKNVTVTEDRLKFFYDKKPSFIATGKSGFSGYWVFGYSHHKNIFLESQYYGNATYLLNENWEELSKKTKSELINSNLSVARVIHDENWDKNIQTYFETNNRPLS